MNKIRAGDYYLVYRCDFASSHLCKKLNITFTGPRDLVESAVVRRIDPSSIKDKFFDYLQRRHKDRLF